MTLSERAEEILESLWIAIVEQKREGCDALVLKDDSALAELVDAGLVKLHDSKVILLAKGREESRNCIRRHRLAERLMVDVLDIRKKLVHETSCKFEHLLHKGVDENICTLLGHPRTCPHGRPIPEGPCCREAKIFPKRLIMRLDELGSGKRARVAYLQTGDRSALDKIMAIGILPNTEVELVQTSPSYVVKIGKSQFAIDKELASRVHVRVG
jgi:DtxR family Mn-dependent transcriptional regulator